MTLVCVKLRKITSTEDLVWIAEMAPDNLVFLRHYAYPGLTEENEPLSISLAGQDPGREKAYVGQKRCGHSEDSPSLGAKASAECRKLCAGLWW